MKLYAKSRSEQAVTDPYSVLHYSAGLATGLGGIGALEAVLGAVVLDIVWSALFKSQPTGLLRKSENEPPINKVADIALFALGNYMGRRWNGD